MHIGIKKIEINIVNIIKSFILLILANFLYQGTISYFVVLVILFNIFKNKDMNLKEYIKNNYKSIILFILLYGGSCIVEFVSLKLYLALANVSSLKVGSVKIIYNFYLIRDMILSIISNMMGMINPFIFDITYFAKFENSLWLFNCNIIFKHNTLK